MGVRAPATITDGLDELPDDGTADDAADMGGSSVWCGTTEPTERDASPHRHREACRAVVPVLATCVRSLGCDNRTGGALQRWGGGALAVPVAGADPSGG